MSEVISLEERRQTKKAVHRVELDVLFTVTYPGQLYSGIHIPGLQIVHWGDTNTGIWEPEIASLAVRDDENPSIVGLCPGFMDCLTCSDLGDSKKHYYLRRSFYEYFSEAIADLGYPPLQPNCVVSAIAKEIQVANFDHRQVGVNAEPTICKVIPFGK